MEKVWHQKRHSRKRTYKEEYEEVQVTKSKKQRMLQDKSGPDQDQGISLPEKFRNEPFKNEQLDGENTSDTDSFTDPANFNKLNRLIQSGEPDNIITKLLTPRFGFIDRLNRGTTTPMLTEMLIRVMSAACQTKNTDSLIKLLCYLNGSKFMKVDLLQYLNVFVTDEEASVKTEVLQQILSICKVLVKTFPRNSLDTLTLLLAPIHYLRRSGRVDVSTGELDEELISVRRHIQLKVPTRDLEKEETCMVDTENFRCLSITPTCEDIKGSVDPYLRKNKIFLRYADVNDYLDVQFRLLREDLVRPLREALADLLESRKEGTGKKRASVMKVYQKVQIVSRRCSLNVYEIHFDTSRLKRVRWGAGKRLLFGSIVCLSADQFQTMLIGTIAERNVRDLSKGVVFVHFENETTWANSFKFNFNYEMIESPTYYEPYKNVLGVLHYLDEKALPFQKYLLNQGHNEVPPPKYLLNRNWAFDFSSAIKQIDNEDIQNEEELQFKEKYVPVLNPSEWPSSERLGLDESQYSALKTALTKEFAVIQGPPGTGKTFIGVLIVQLLLANKYRPNIGCWWNLFFNTHRPIRESLWDGPILIVCYTNHALDQFLEEIIERHPDKLGYNEIVRIGNRCSSENQSLKRCLLSEIMRKSSWRGEIYRKKKRLRETENDYLRLAAFVELAGEEILHEDALKDFMFPAQFEMLNRRRRWEPSVLLHWLYDNRGNVWQTNILCQEAEAALVQEEEDYSEGWNEQSFVGRECNANSSKLVNDLQECKNKIRERDFFCVRQDDFYFETWQRMRILHHRFHKKKPFYEADVWRLSPSDRWRLYNYWVSLWIDEKMAERQNALEGYSQQKTHLDSILSNAHYDILAEAEVIAMTTTSAAKNSELLKRVKPKIVIVEEAAEVLEAHIVASLSKDCQHLILIGDHQQLRPKTADHHLARHYWLQVSLFERMLLNGMNGECLAIQHRMRPEISRLLVPHIYRSLRDHDNVREYDNVAGVIGNLFFLNHSYEESSVDDIKSHSNEHEASFLAAFCKYLLKIGYDPNKITVLTLYTGQLFLMRNYFPTNGVRITPVDNFQGEENDIILLSLVRSNKQNNIGFLSIPNRVCVALSRARKGLYIMGNGDLLRDSSPLWRDILETLKREGRLVDKLPLGCRKHPENIVYVTCAADFDNVPENGCNKRCEFRLDCGHACGRNCHPFDQKHTEYKCKKPCQRKPKGCKEGHACQRLCCENCNYCQVLVDRTLSDCKHDVKMPCYMSEDRFRCKERCKKLCKAGHQCRDMCWESCGYCQEPSTRILTLCRHEATIPCYMDEATYLQANHCRVQVERILTRCGHLARMDCCRSEYDYSCEEVCAKKCPYGHPCTKKCYEYCGDCVVKVEKVLPRCHHSVRLPCHQSEEAYECKAKCTKTCPDEQLKHPCPKLCCEPCGDCQIPVLRKLPLCQHEAKIACHFNLTEYKCMKPCEVLCPVGHRCPRICGVKCNAKCQVKVVKVLPRCKHSTMVECHKSPDDVVCPSPCEKLLSCGHKCQETCGAPDCTVLCKSKVEKLLPCGHRVRIECFEDPETYLCVEEIEVTTCNYGHKKMVECCISVTDLSQCQTPVIKVCSTKRHKFTVPCSLQNSTEYNHGCPEKCNVKLSCGHHCAKVCKQCVMDTRHSDCAQVCKKYYPLCSHKCQLKCGIPCGKCYMQCVIECQHRSLEWRCSEPYKPCEKRCSWTCPHLSCEALCCEPCNRAPCNKPCQYRVAKCGHSCVGLCGEVCPKLCRICDNGKLEEMAKDLNVKISGQSRFVMLKPCDHVIETTYMDAWVKEHMKTFPPYKLRGALFLKCPVCTKKVSCPRYNREIKTYELHLNMAKERILESERLTRQASAYKIFNRLKRDLPKDIMKNRLNCGTLCLLCETQKLLGSVEKNDRFCRALDEIEDILCLSTNFPGGEQTLLANCVIRLYRMYLELQIFRLNQSIRGPKLRTVKSCEEIFKSLSSVNSKEIDFPKTWNALQVVNRRLSTDLDRRERQDNIEDYIRHMNGFFDLEFNAKFTSQWFCCANGHVYSREEDIKEDQIDCCCPLCHPVHERLLKILGTNPSKTIAASTEDAIKSEHCHDESTKTTQIMLETNVAKFRSSGGSSGDQIPEKEQNMPGIKCTIISASPNAAKRPAAETTVTKIAADVASSTIKILAAATSAAVKKAATVAGKITGGNVKCQDRNIALTNHAEGTAGLKKTYSTEVKDAKSDKPPQEVDTRSIRQKIPENAPSSRKRRREDSPTDNSHTVRNEHKTATTLLDHNRGWTIEEEEKRKRWSFSEIDHRWPNEDRYRKRTDRRTPDEERYFELEARKRNAKDHNRYSPTFEPYDLDKSPDYKRKRRDKSVRIEHLPAEPQITDRSRNGHCRNSRNSRTYEEARLEQRAAMERRSANPRTSPVQSGEWLSYPSQRYHRKKSTPDCEITPREIIPLMDIELRGTGEELSWTSNGSACRINKHHPNHDVRFEKAERRPEINMHRWNEDFTGNNTNPNSKKPPRNDERIYSRQGSHLSEERTTTLTERFPDPDEPFLQPSSSQALDQTRVSYDEEYYGELIAGVARFSSSF